MNAFFWRMRSLARTSSATVRARRRVYSRQLSIWSRNYHSTLATPQANLGGGELVDATQLSIRTARQAMLLGDAEKAIGPTTGHDAWPQRVRFEWGLPTTELRRPAERRMRAPSCALLRHSLDSSAPRRLSAGAAGAARSFCSCPHATLGLEPGASPAEIKRRYLELAREHHPDVSRARGGAAAGAPPAAELNQAAGDQGGEPGQDGGVSGAGAGAGGGGGRPSLSMASLNTAYEALSDPRHREAARAAGDLRREATAAAAALAAAGRARQALAAFFACEETPGAGPTVSASGAPSRYGHTRCSALISHRLPKHSHPTVVSY